MNRPFRLDARKHRTKPRTAFTPAPLRGAHFTLSVYADDRPNCQRGRRRIDSTSDAIGRSHSPSAGRNPGRLFPSYVSELLKVRRTSKNFPSCSGNRWVADSSVASRVGVITSDKSYITGIFAEVNN